MLPSLRVNLEVFIKPHLQAAFTGSGSVCSFGGLESTPHSAQGLFQAQEKLEVLANQIRINCIEGKCLHYNTTSLASNIMS